MGRRPKWIAEGAYARMPHADGPPASLWWWRSLGLLERSLVIAQYMAQVGKGRKLDEGLKDDLESWAKELSTPQKIGKRATRYWTIPALAAAKGLHPKTFCKRFRELEGIAMKQAPDRVPIGQVRLKVTDEIKSAIRARFAEVCHDMDAFRIIAREYNVTPARVGQLCLDLKRKAEGEREGAPPVRTRNLD